jgi:hypothetical protein
VAREQQDLHPEFGSWAPCKLTASQFMRWNYSHLKLSITWEHGQNVGNHFERWNVGVLGPVTLSGLNKGKRDLSHQKWTYQVIHSELSKIELLISSSSLMNYS